MLQAPQPLAVEIARENTQAHTFSRTDLAFTMLMMDHCNMMIKDIG